MLVGEAPGADEDDQGVPFVGPAGRKLDSLLAQVGIARADLFVSNLVHCRPPDNDLRPYPSATFKCPPLWLEKEIEAVDPAVIVALGITAGTCFFPGIGSAHELAGTARRGM